MVRILFLIALLAFALSASAAQASPDAKPAATFTDTPPPPPSAPAPKDVPRNDKPMGDYTKSFAKKEFTVESGTDRHAMTYYWRQPDKIDPSQTYPLVIVLHDETGTAAAAEYLLGKGIHDVYPSFVVVPMLPARKIWSFPSEYPDDPAIETKNAKAVQALNDVYDLIHDVQKNFPVDEKRIYITGCGDGGFGVYGAVYNDSSNMFAAAIPMNGGWTQKQTQKLAKSKTAWYSLHGTDDKTYSAYLDSVVAFDIQKMKGNIHFLQVPGLGHECNDPRLFSALLWKWMYAQHRT